MIARYASTCQACRQPIKAGAPIRRDANRGQFVHAECAKPARTQAKGCAECGSSAIPMYRGQPACLTEKGPVCDPCFDRGVEALMQRQARRP